MRFVYPLIYNVKWILFLFLLVFSRAYTSWLNRDCRITRFLDGPVSDGPWTRSETVGQSRLQDSPDLDRPDGPNSQKPWFWGSVGGTDLSNASRTAVFDLLWMLILVPEMSSNVTFWTKWILVLNSRVRFEIDFWFKIFGTVTTLKGSDGPWMVRYWLRDLMNYDRLDRWRLYWNVAKAMRSMGKLTSNGT